MPDHLPAVLDTKEFLLKLMDPARTPGVPPEVRKRAKQLVDRLPSPAEALVHAG